MFIYNIYKLYNHTMIISYHYIFIYFIYNHIMIRYYHYVIIYFSFLLLLKLLIQIRNYHLVEAHTERFREENWKEIFVPDSSPLTMD